ncbi:uncharacterized protein FFC1_15900 [Fusarium fujikuroi]
MPALY